MNADQYDCISARELSIWSIDKKEIQICNKSYYISKNINLQLKYEIN